MFSIAETCPVPSVLRAASSVEFRDRARNNSTLMVSCTCLIPGESNGSEES